MTEIKCFLCDHTSTSHADNHTHLTATHHDWVRKLINEYAPYIIHQGSSLMGFPSSNRAP